MIELHHEFRVALPADEAWTVLTDLPRIASCLRGASLDEVVDGEYRGGLSTRVGPISATFRGVATFEEIDEVAHRAVVAAQGREAKGSGSASALITMVLKPDKGATTVDVSTELAISGRMAQFGRSMITEISNSMVEEFTKNLESMITAPDTGRGADVTGESTVQHSASGAKGDQLDVVSTLALPVLRRIAVPAGTTLLGLCLGYLLGRVRKRRR